MKNSTLKMALFGTIFLFSLNLTLKAQTVTVDSVATPIGITNTTAFTGGWVTTAEVLTERGVCYGTTDNPTIDDNTVPSFKSSPTVPYEPTYLEGLMPNTTYYIRAYATSSAGTVYSASKSFTTSNNAEALWQLAGSTGFEPAITGGITAESMAIDDSTKINGWDKNNGKTISIGSDYLKIYPQGDKPHGEIYVDSVYFGFKVAPRADINFTVKKLNMVCSGYKTGGATLAFAYSLDGFATQDSLGMATLDDKDRTQSGGTVEHPIKPGSGSLDDEFANIGQMYISFDTDIEVPQGQTLSVRMWSWGKSGLTMLMKDVIISGEASVSAAQGTAVIDSVSTVIGITNTTAFTGSWVNAMDGALTERGVCYSTSENPTIVNNTVPSFKLSPTVPYEPAYLEGLMPNTTYYVRAYGKNASGVSYSAQKSFKTSENAEVLWQLSNFRQFESVVTGDIKAESMGIADSTKINGWDKNNGKTISIGSDYLKIYPQGDKPHGESYVDSVYFSFNVRPKTDIKYTVKKLNMVCAGYKSGATNIAFAYSLDGFATQDSLGLATLDDKDLTQSRGTLNDPIKPGSGSLDDEFANIGQMYFSFDTDIEVPAGDSLSIRMYTWGKSGLTVLMKDVILSGETEEVIVIDDANLTSISLDPAAALSPAFSSDVTSYTVELPTGTSSVNVTATKSDPDATVSGDGSIDLSSGTGTATIIVTAEDGTTTKTYTVAFTVSNLSNDASLTAITLDPAAALTPAFSSDVLNYTVELPAGTTSVNVSVTKGDPNATLRGDGAIDVSSGTGTATIIVSAEDGTSQIYTVVFTVITGVKDLSAANISIYPNPASNFVNIEGLSNNTSIIVFNSLGKLVSDNFVNSNNFQLDIRNYKGGMYFVRIVSDNEVFATKFIKE